MVVETKKVKKEKTILNSVIIEDNLNWSTVSLDDILKKGKRLEASFFDIESKY